jgi:hypothetical protein
MHKTVRCRASRHQANPLGSAVTENHKGAVKIAPNFRVDDFHRHPKNSKSGSKKSPIKKSCTTKSPTKQFRQKTAQKNRSQKSLAKRNSFDGRRQEEFQTVDGSAEVRVRATR